ncbi:8-amino-7-oxononanoate synthase [Parabacteroides bouchesdurhonensis]|uniref:8-amino-7-oxononanoate synthase n=1 Tax=Parabacteroides bouchesdurhonensis TaxID=1936995 RepID=UPI000C84192C|nr:8-amino-7-oxononanoate synthase [Parabacteroides bouchesdurhonensis]
MKDYNKLLNDLKASGGLRHLPEVAHQSIYIEKGGQTMLNLSSNDYLGLAARLDLRNNFLDRLRESGLPLSSTSSRLLTGNYSIYTELEQDMADRFGREACLLFNSGYHANTGILPALADKRTLILADKLVHASIIDGILLSNAPFRRFRHNDYGQLEQLLGKEAADYEQVIIATESIFSMDGDVGDLRRLVSLKKQYPNVMLYVDEAHAIGVRGNNGLGIAEEQGCIKEIDLLVGTFGKAFASMGAYLLCSDTIRQYLINTMRPLIFSTALPPAQIAWTKYLFDLLPSFDKEREQLRTTSRLLREQLQGHGGEISDSHIVPYIIGENDACIAKAEELQRKGFYCLPVRPPTVPQGTSRIRFSLTAAVDAEAINNLSSLLNK